MVHANATLQCLPSRVRHGERHGIAQSGPNPSVPTLFRFLVITAILGGLVWGGMIALVTYVDPEPREITVTVPPQRLGK
jgi:hypothetical protein